MAKALLRDLVDRGLDPDRARLVVIDGAKALASAIRAVCGPLAAIQRCQLHKRRNMLGHLPEQLHAQVTAVLRDAWAAGAAALAQRQLERLAASLETDHPGAAASVREGLADTLTRQRFGMAGALYTTLRTTNAIENFNGSSTTYAHNVKRWYCAPGFLGHGLRENLMSKEVAGMVQSRRVKGTGSARTEGARRASGVGADGAAVGAGALAPGQRWSASRKRDVVLRLLRGESLDTVSREVGVELYRLEAWQARALAGLELGLKAQAGEPLAAELDTAKRHIGELSMENELLRERARAAERRLPLATRRSRR